MAITVKHNKVSTIPDDADTSLVRPSDWNDDHVLTGTVPVANGGTGASTLTGYVKGNGTSTMMAASTIPNTDITGLGTASTKDAGVANGVATLDSGGKVPTSELPAAILGALNYQGTWNANTNTPTLTSSVGTKGYYYVVSVAGTTNLNGITDWQIGDWAVFNGSEWQKVDNTDAGGDVVGPASATDNAVARFDSTTGKLIQNSVTLIDDTGNASGILSQQFSNGSAVTLAAGKMWYDGSTGAWNAGMGGGNITQQIGEELFVYGKASAAITDSPLQIIYQTGVVGASGVITFAPTIAGITDGTLILGVATESLANNGFGRITSYGVVRGITTNGTAFSETWADGDEIYYNPVTGNPTNIKPVAPNVKVSVGTLIKAGAGGSGSIQVEINHGSVLGGTDANVQLTSVTNGNILTYDGGNGYWKNTDLTAGTAISVAKSANGVLTVNNTGVTSAVAGTGISVSGATGAVTVTNSAPDQTVVLTAGTGISTSGTYPNFTITNTSPSSGGTVTSVAALTLGTTGTDLSSTVANGTTTPVITLQVPTASAANRGALSAADWTTFNGKAPAVTYTTNYIPYGQGTTTPNQSAGLQFDGTNFTTTGYATATSFRPSSATVPTNGMYLPAANAVGIATNSANSLYITSTGMVGVGTTTPNYTPYGNGTVLTILGNAGSTPASKTGVLELANAATPAAANRLGEISFVQVGNLVSPRVAFINSFTSGSGGANGFGGYLAFHTKDDNVASAAERMRIFASGGVSIGNTTDPGAGNLSVTGTIRTQGYTVATLPAAGTVGRKAYVTNALAPTFLAVVVGGGAVVCPVFDNGTAWVAG